MLSVKEIDLLTKLATTSFLQAQYAVSKGLGGAMVWSIDTDDFQGNCFGKSFILIKSIYETMNGPIIYPSSNPQINSITSG